MKSLIRSIILALSLVGLAPATLAGSFVTPELPISDINVGSQFPEVAVYNSIIHVVFVGYGVGSQGDIYYTRSTNNGGSFSTPIILSGATGNDRPQVTAGVNGVFVAWNSNNDTGAVYVRRSSNGGVSFDAAFIAAGVEGGSYSRLTDLLTDASGNVHIGYYDNGGPSGAGMVHHRMICSGTTLGTDTAVTSTAIDGDYDNEQPRLGEAGGKVYIVYRSSRNGNPQGGWPPYSIQMQTATVAGCAATWSYPARRIAGGVPLNFGSTWRPEVVGEASGLMHVTWWENAQGANVFYRRGNISSGTLGAPAAMSAFGIDHLEPGALSSTASTAAGGFQVPPGFVTNGTQALIAYQRNSVINGQNVENGPIFLRESADNGVTWGTEMTIATAASTPRVALGASDVSVVWMDVRTGGTARIYYRRYTFADQTVFNTNVSNVVTSYYQTILGRAPDIAGRDFWIGEANRVISLGADVREVFFALSIDFLNSQEYRNRNRTNGEYLTDLYQTFFSRAPDGPGFAYWTDQMNQGMDRGAILTNFLFSTEFTNTMTSIFGSQTIRGEINLTIDLYRGIMGRLPDSAGFNFYLGRMRAAQCQGSFFVQQEVRNLATQFINSPEYGNIELARPAPERIKRHVGDLYNAFMRRGADLPGYNFYTQQITSGAQTRDQVRESFLQSPEFQNRLTQVQSETCIP